MKGRPIPMTTIKQTPKHWAKRAVRATPLTIPRWYVRHAPGSVGKYRLVAGILDEGLKAAPRDVVSRTQWGGRFAGNTGDILDRYLYEFGVWEPSLTSWISSRLGADDVFVDIGANVGYYSILASRLVGPNGIVVAVEAEPATFEMLEQNVRRNNATNVRALNLAASDSAGTLELHSGAPWNRGMAGPVAERWNSAGPESDSWTDVVTEVEAQPVGAIISDDELARMRLMKIDVEGGEPAVLRGLFELLDRTREDLELVVEIDPGLFEAQKEDPAAYLGRFREAGFNIYKLATNYTPSSYVTESTSRPKPWDGEFDLLADYILSRAAPSEI